MALYHIGLMGNLDGNLVETLSQTLRAAVDPMGIADHLVISGPQTAFNPPADYSSVGVYFGGGQAQPDEQHLRQLMSRGTPILPVVQDLSRFAELVPRCLHPINGQLLSPTDPDMERLSSSVLGTLGLLPRQRRLFLSYKRSESRDAALQLFEGLSARQFDVFLDTHGVPPGEHFQEVLYHRLSDSDVLVMLDTPSFFESRWTEMEFGKAMAKSLSIVRLGWPNVAPSPRLLSGESIQFDEQSFEGNLLSPDALEVASVVIERVRSRCIAIRSAEMVGALEVAVRKVGGQFEGLGERRSAVLRLHDGHRVLVFPSTGVPTAEHLHQVTTFQDQVDSRAVLYDDCGVALPWQEHLRWLGSEIKAARWLTLGRAKWDLSTWSQDATT